MKKMSEELQENEPYIDEENIQEETPMPKPP
jgi:hypothetical protein